MVGTPSLPLVWAWRAAAAGEVLRGDVPEETLAHGTRNLKSYRNSADNQRESLDSSPPSTGGRRSPSRSRPGGGSGGRPGPRPGRSTWEPAKGPRRPGWLVRESWRFMPPRSCTSQPPGRGRTLPAFLPARCRHRSGGIHKAAWHPSYFRPQGPEPFILAQRPHEFTRPLHSLTPPASWLPIPSGRAGCASPTAASTSSTLARAWRTPGPGRLLVGLNSDASGGARLSLLQPAPAGRGTPLRALVLLGLRSVDAVVRFDRHRWR